VNFRAMASELLSRSRFADALGMTFGGVRDVYKALGYKKEISLGEFRARFDRNGVANAIVKAMPLATWRGGAAIIEDEDLSIVTPFEDAFDALDRRLKIWAKLQRVDTLSGIGRYAVLVIGAPGAMDTPLVRATADSIVYLQPYAEEDATIDTFDEDVASPRFGLPVFYSVKRTTMQGSSVRKSVAKRVHHSRVLHVSEGLLDDNIYGEPKLQCVWNDLDNLEKVAGGGAEAYWRRADRGMQFDIDPTVDFGEGAEGETEKTGLKTQLEEYEHGLRRFLTTRGLTVNELGSDVADFKSPVESIMSLICTAVRIPLRVFTGSEQGKLAAKQDRVSWDNRVRDRQLDYADPCIVSPLVDRFIAIGALPVPADGYEVRWSSNSAMDDEQRGQQASTWASLNDHGEVVVTADEIREHVLGLPPLDEMGEIGLTAAAKGGATTWKQTHRVADRFRRAHSKGVLAGVRGVARGSGSRRASSGGAGPRPLSGADTGRRGRELIRAALGLEDADSRIGADS
jgi:hypothetical protein